MDNAHLSRFPHLSWLMLRSHADVDGQDFVFRTRHNSHWLSCSLRRSATVKVIRNARANTFPAPEKTVRYAPSDSIQQIVIRHADYGHEFAVYLIPEGHLDRIADEEQVQSPQGMPGWIRVDEGLFSLMKRLATASAPEDATSHTYIDEVARQVILRVIHLNGGCAPDWHDDSSVFDRRTLLGLVAYTDEHLCFAPSLSDISLLVGLSPSHVAKKFRQSTGLSLCHFINRRRILRSLETLKTESPLVSIALDLGFSSQSHFTRVFSDLTGMTPAKYRKQVRPRFF